MKLRIKLNQVAKASNSYPNDDLSTLRAGPNGAVPKFDTTDEMHFDAARHPNNLGQGILKPTISRRKKKLKRDKKKAQKDQDALKLEIEKQKQPKENNNVVDTKSQG